MKLVTFPSKCKIAKLIPLFKKGIKAEAKNDRHISLLPLISKVIEKSFHYQMQDYLQKNELVYIYQSGFRANHSRDKSLFRLTDMFLNGAENKNTEMILNDLQKAFDILDHNFFFRQNEVHRFFRSFDNVLSEVGIINCGVPQRSILGPLLFLLYITDISQTLSDNHTYLYADDTSIFIYMCLTILRHCEVKG